MNYVRHFLTILVIVIACFSVYLTSLDSVYAIIETDVYEPDVVNQTYVVQKHLMWLAERSEELCRNFGICSLNEMICNLVWLDADKKHKINADPDMTKLSKILEGANDPLTPGFLGHERKALKIDPSDPNNELNEQKKSISSERCVPFCEIKKSDTLIVSENLPSTVSLLQSGTWFNSYFNARDPISQDETGGTLWDTNYASEYMDPKAAHSCGAPQSESVELEFTAKVKDGRNNYEGDSNIKADTACDPTADPKKPCIIGVSNRWPWSETYTCKFGICEPLEEQSAQTKQAVAQSDGGSQILGASTDSETEFAYSPLQSHPERMNQLINESGFLATMVTTKMRKSFKLALNGRNKNTFFDNENEENSQELDDIGHLNKRNLEQGHMMGCTLYPSTLNKTKIPQWGPDCYYGKNMEQSAPPPSPIPTESISPEPTPVIPTDEPTEAPEPTEPPVVNSPIPGPACTGNIPITSPSADPLDCSSYTPVNIPPREADTTTLYYEIPYTNTSCTLPNSEDTKNLLCTIADLGYIGGENLQNYWNWLTSQAQSQGINPLFALTLWIEESGANAEPGNDGLGSKVDPPYNGSNLSEHLQAQLASLSRETCESTDFENFMCVWAGEGGYPDFNCGGCMPNHDTFAPSVAKWYDVLTSISGVPDSCNRTDTRSKNACD